jgi:Arc/MetJ family transcription regulator
MRTTLDIPEDLLEEARRLLQFKSKTDTIIFSLRELVRRRRIEDLKSLMGHVDLKLDLDSQRRRPARRPRKRPR